MLFNESWQVLLSRSNKNMEESGLVLSKKALIKSSKSCKESQISFEQL